VTKQRYFSNFEKCLSSVPKILLCPACLCCQKFGGTCPRQLYGAGAYECVLIIMITIMTSGWGLQHRPTSPITKKKYKWPENSEIWFFRIHYVNFNRFQSLLPFAAGHMSPTTIVIIELFRELNKLDFNFCRDSLRQL